MFSENTVKQNHLASNTVTSRPQGTSKGNSRNLGIGSKVAIFFNRHLIYWALPLTILVVWHVLVQVGVITPRILPAPVAILRAAIRLAASGELLQGIAISALRALTGLLVGGGIGLLLGLMNGMFPRSEKLLDTTLQMLRTVPNLALVPLVILWFGIGDGARLFLIAEGVLFSMYINTFHGIRQVDPGLIEMGRAYGLSTRELFWEVILPGALPSILLGLRVALGVMWLTLIIAETIAADSGIGHMANQAREFMRTDVMVFAIILYALLGKLADVIARALEGRLLQWHPRHQNSVETRSI
ncbi:MAG: ABC transporter permease subunit [Chloroflexi bacterium]|nr:ABC transporter permease subunit [Chloroflexota bacterium]